MGKLQELFGEILDEIENEYKSHLRNLKDENTRLIEEKDKVAKDLNSKIAEYDELAKQYHGLRGDYSGTIKRYNALKAENDRIIAENEQLKTFINQKIQGYYGTGNPLQEKANETKAKNKKQRADAIIETISWLNDNQHYTVDRNGKCIFDVQTIIDYLKKYHHLSAEYNTIRVVATEKWGDSIGFKNTVAR